MSLLFGETDVNHIIVYLNGETETVLIDSMNQDWIYYKTPQTETSKIVSTEKIYFIYNDFNRILYYGWHLRESLNRVEHKSGFLISVDNDTIPYRDIQFNRHMIKPEILVTAPNDTAFYVDFLDIHKLESDFSILSYSAKHGFVWSSALFLLSKGFSQDFIPKLSVLNVDSTGSAYPWTSYMIPSAVYGTMIWDYYFKKNTLYFNPLYANKPFDRSMYIFSLTQIIKTKSQRYYRQFSQSKFGMKILSFIKDKKA